MSETVTFNLVLAVLLLGVVLAVSVFHSRLRAEAAHRHADQRFRLFVESIRDYAIYMLDPKGNVIEWNAGAERVKGYSAEEIIGKHFSRFYTEAGRDAGRPEQALALALKNGKFEEQAWRVRKDGKRFLANVTIEPLRDASGHLIGFAKITRDIDERVQQQQALAQYQKMDALGQLTGGIAHDFNNLLHVMKNATVILEKRLQGVGPDVSKYLEMLTRNVDRATSLTHRLLAFSRRQVLDPKPISPNSLVVELTALLDQALGESVAVESVVGAGTWWINADANQLETAILNLAINARDAMAGRGRLTIEMSNAFLDEKYASAQVDVKPGQYVMIAVSDTGSGMTKEVAAKAFDPFFTTKELGRGTGLGLSQVYGFIKQSGGHVKIYSELGAGTTVKLYLPRLVGPGLVQEEEAAPVPAAPQKQTVLIVEDDGDVRQFTADVLRERGYRVLTAGDADAALRMFEDHPEIDLLFTDIGLPGGMNGRELADLALARRPALRVLFTTGYTRNAIIHHGRLDAGVNLIVKPFTQSSLALKLQQVLDDKSGTRGDNGAAPSIGAPDKV